MKNPLYLVFAIGPNFLSVDTFFLISGLLSTRSFLNLKKNSEERMSLLVTLKYIYNRMLRLQPLHLYVVCLAVALYSLVPWGSAWEKPEHELNNCRASWWTNILLLNNFVNVENAVSLS
ncbi:hypothetical protein NDU88_005953 [Pleurodeles waltl]|uniref:Uncharacterized protein n=1 Tax=Pleurodeles waltl TaxID=8319 RepID=A0AAV7WC58_PLEWA|nr:hypothetical protein NDU88_005953 [Pleurodeles waltl]